MRQKHTQFVHFKLEGEDKSQSKTDMLDFRPDESIESSVDEQSDDYLEILKLRHRNLSKLISNRVFFFSFKF